MREIYQNTIEVDLTELFFYIIRKWILILCVCIVCCSAGFAYGTLKYKKIFQTSAQIYVNTDKKTLSLDSIGLISSESFMQKIKTTYDLAYSAAQLEGMVSVSACDDGFRTINITVTMSDPYDAVDFISAYCNLACEEIYAVQQVEATTANDITEPISKMTGKKPLKMALLGLVGGLFAACAIIVLQYLLSTEFILKRK